MEENLIEEVKKYNAIYKKSSMEYRNRKLKAEAWEKVSLAMNLPESMCMTRWRSLRDRFVKEYAKTQHASGSAADVPDTEWHLYSNLMFLRDQIKPRKTMTSLMQPLVDYSEELTENENSAPDPLSNVGTENEYFWNNTDASVANVSLDNSNQTLAGGEETLLDTTRSSTKARDVSLDNSNQIPAGGEETLIDTSRSNTKARKRSNPNPEEFGDFLKKMTNIAEKRFCSKSTPDQHDGFFSMVNELFSKMDEGKVQESKMFFLNYLHEQILYCNPSSH